VRDGVLLCYACRLRYPDVNRVPVMLLYRAASMRNSSASIPPPGGVSDHARPTRAVAASGRRRKPSPRRGSHRGGRLRPQLHYTQEELVRHNRESGEMLPRSPEKSRARGVAAGRQGTRRLAAPSGKRNLSTNIICRSCASAERWPSPHLHVTSCSCSTAVAEAAFDLVTAKRFAPQPLHPGGVCGDRSVRAAARVSLRLGLRHDDHLVKKGWTACIARINYHVEMVLRPALSVAPKLCARLLFAAVVDSML
jgi:hypothetical protein